MSDERPPGGNGFTLSDDGGAPRHPMCRCTVGPESVTDLIAVQTHPDLIELDAWMDNLYRGGSGPA